jgi:hypothetical protein
MERETGIEPATTGLGSRCSTIELLPLVCSQNNITAPRPSPLGITQPLQTIESKKQYYAQAVLKNWLTVFTHDPAIP